MGVAGRLWGAQYFNLNYRLGLRNERDESPSSSKIVRLCSNLISSSSACDASSIRTIICIGFMIFFLQLFLRLISRRLKTSAVARVMRAGALHITTRHRGLSILRLRIESMNCRPSCFFPFRCLMRFTRMTLYWLNMRSFRSKSQLSF